MIRNVLNINYPLSNLINRNIVANPRCLIVTGKRCYNSESRPKGSKLKKVLYATTAIVIGSTGLVLYAKHDLDFQKWLSSNIPGFDFVSKPMLEENNVLNVYFVDPIVRFTDSVYGLATRLISSDETTQAKPKDNISEKKSLSTVPIVESTSSNTPPGILELEKTIITSVQDCTNAYSNLNKVVKDYGVGVQRLIGNSFNKIDSRLWTELGKFQEEKQKLFYIATAKVDVAINLVDKMKGLLQDASLPIATDVRQRIMSNMDQILNKVNEMKRTLQMDRTTTVVSDQYWEDVQKARKYFFEELDSLVAKRGIYDPKVHLSDEELNIFLSFAYQKILFFEKELRSIEEANKSQANDSISKLKNKEEIIEAIVQAEVRREKRKLQEEFEKKELLALVEAQMHAKSQVKLQAEAHLDLLNEAVLNKEQEMKRQFRHELDEKIDKLKLDGKINIAGMVGKLRGYNDALNKQLLERKQARDAQKLWGACQKFKTLLELPQGIKLFKEELIPLKNDVDVICNSSDQDEFVKAVVSTIPKVALERGVYTKMALQDRFLKVEKVASQMSQIDTSELTIPQLFVSWLQNALVFKNIKPITINEIKNEPVDVSTFTTNDILRRARYWLECGDFLQAVQYMNLLNGAAKEVAKNWIEEATIYLETLQAADILIAHACAGCSNIS